MDYGKMVGDSFAYAKEGLVGKWVKWNPADHQLYYLPLILGYMVRISRVQALRRN